MFGFILSLFHNILGIIILNTYFKLSNNIRYCFYCTNQTISNSNPSSFLISKNNNIYYIILFLKKWNVEFFIYNKLIGLVNQQSKFLEF